jgi:hypothetical protein
VSAVRYSSSAASSAADNLPLDSPPAGERIRLEAADPLDSAPLPFDPVLIAAGFTVAARSLWRGLFGWKRYRGNAEAICRAVIDDCWTGDYLGGSAGHFRQFWTRDLAMCTPALCRLGYRDQVLASWEWGLERFERAGRITTTIFYNRFPRDVYAYACDSLPMTLFALREAGAEHLIARHRELFGREIQRFYETVFDPDLGLARTSGYFSGPRDCMTGRSTVFANTMIALLGQLLDGESLLPNPFAGHDMRDRLLQHHWTGSYFRDSLCRELPSGDANVWPFFFGIFDGGPEAAAMRRSAFATLEERGFTDPVPLRYFERRLPDSELPIPKLFTPNYQGDPSWTQLGAVYLSELAKVDRARMVAHRTRMAELIERDGNYLELYNPDGKPYVGRARIYHCDEGMIWASLFLDLYR